MLIYCFSNVVSSQSLKITTLIEEKSIKISSYMLTNYPHPCYNGNDKALIPNYGKRYRRCHNMQTRMMLKIIVLV
jgi:hypothetical protein